MTGVGQTTPAGTDGLVARDGALPIAAAPVTVRIGGPRGTGLDAQVLYAGAEDGLVAGIMRIKAVIPLDSPGNYSRLAPGSYRFQVRAVRATPWRQPVQSLGSGTVRRPGGADD